MAKQLSNNSSQLRVWIKELRAPFFTAVLAPVLLGASIAWFYFRAFDLAYLVLCLIGSVFINAGTNLANDYFDYKSGCDTINTDFISPFSGGSGILPRGLLSPRRVYMASIIFFALAAVIGTFFALTRGWPIAVIGIAGIISGYFYTTEFATRGIGEFIAGLNCGPLVALGSFYVQAQTITPESVIASIPLGILISAILWINEFPDRYADHKVGKKTLVTRMEKTRAAAAFSVIMFSPYAIIVLGVVLSLMPPLALISLLTIPMALKAVNVAKKNYDDPRKLVPANAGTVMVHLITGLLLTAAYVISGLIASV